MMSSLCYRAIPKAMRWWLLESYLESDCSNGENAPRDLDVTQCVYVVDERPLEKSERSRRRLGVRAPSRILCAGGREDELDKRGVAKATGSRR